MNSLLPMRSASTTKPSARYGRRPTTSRIIRSRETLTGEKWRSGLKLPGKVLSDGIARVERVTVRAAPIANAPFRKFRRLIWLIAADYTTRRVNREQKERRGEEGG